MSIEEVEALEKLDFKLVLGGEFLELVRSATRPSGGEIFHKSVNLN